ncbi:histidine phosphatase family protein [Microterricola viridarii]|uniref:Probable phosphoglycerate mutase n=1 Tax=Microterricola viridarii TaxID=412690 RepID=A0A1H1YD11_9MICO|nr:histidine phosphatase family protein [Microterricola viridarii]SDT19255.1 probable phosphoglycerate mutase [Microterricola viridarii]
MRLFLIRHGQTPSNVIGALDTAVPGPALTELGMQQASAIGELLGAEPIAAVYASSQLRAQQTAAPLARLRSVELGVRDGLREITAGELEMLTDRRSVMEYIETCMAWAAGELDARIRGGENGHEAFGRFDEVIAEIAASGVESAALVSHGAMLRSWAGYSVRNLDAAFVSQRVLTNTGVVVLNSDGPDWVAESWLGDAVATGLPE